MGVNLRRTLRSTRIGELPTLVRRVMGLPYLSSGDFLPDISSDQADRMAALASHSRGGGPRPILLFGVMPRSGTNYIRDLIAAHPQVCADPGRIYEFPLLHAASSAAGFMDDFHALFPANAEVTDRWDALSLLSGSWLRELQKEAEERQILLKCPHVQYLSLAPHVFPDARIILCIRDGRDVVDSTLKSFSRRALSRKTFSQLAREWALASEAVLAFDEGGKFARPEVAVVRYEDVVRAPEVETRKLLSHAGLEVGDYNFDGIEDLPVRGSSRSTATAEQRWQPEAKRSDFNPISRWELWSARRIKKFDRLAGHALEAAGYER